MGSGLEGIEKQIIPYGVDRLHIFDAPGLFPYTSLPHTSAVVNLFKEEKPEICCSAPRSLDVTSGARLLRPLQRLTPTHAARDRRL